MIRFVAAFILAFAAALPATAEETVVAGLSQNQVSITANFVGSEILVFGAVKRSAPAPDTGALNVVIVIEGPSEPVTVRRKDKRLGIWINTDSVNIDSAPTFYAIATSAPFHDAMNETEDLRYHVSIPRSIRLVGESGVTADAGDFAAALIRIRKDEGLYIVHEGAVNITEDTLFDARIALPSNLTEGEYHARIYLTRGGQVVSEHSVKIEVRKVGIERWIYNLAQDQALIYGFLSLFIAIAAGWGASAGFRLLLRN